MVRKIHKKNHPGGHRVRKGKKTKRARLSPTLFLSYIIYTLTNAYWNSELMKRMLHTEREFLLCPNTTIKGCNNRYTNGVPHVLK